MEAENFETMLRTPKLMVRVQLLLRWNMYLLFNTDIVNFVSKTDEGYTESIVLLILVLLRCFNGRWMRGGGVGKSLILGPAEIASFFSRDFN